jgi:hypothetical protein
MPKLAKHQVPEIKLDGGNAAIDNAFTVLQKQGLFERPGTVMFAIVELTSVAYTGHADGEEKSPHVKVRVSRAEVARDDDEAASLAEAARAMYRRRRMDNTLDEVGAGPQGAEDILASDFAGYPSEEQFKEHKERQRTRDLHNAPR